MNWTRSKTAMLGAVAVLLTAVGACGEATEGDSDGDGGSFPSKNITLIVGYDVGGTTDLVARALADAAEASLDARIVVVNRPGGSGTIGAGEVVAAEPDGYTVGIAGPSTMLIAPQTENLPFGAPDTYQPLTNVVNTPQVLAVRADAPWDSLEAFLGDARADNGNVTVGVSGEGSVAHININALSEAAGVGFNVVPLGGAAAVATNLLGGNVQAAVNTPSAFMDFVDSGDMRLLATFERERNEAYPDVPTVRELGFDVGIDSRLFTFLPAGTPQEVVGILDDAFRQALESETFRQLVLDVGDRADYIGPEELAQTLKEEYAFYADQLAALR